MSHEIKAFIEQARAKGLEDEAIRKKLQDVGWSDQQISAAFGAELDGIDVPLPPANSDANTDKPLSSHAQTQPIAVVQTLSTRGLEYSIMFISLLASAVAVGGLLHSLVARMFYEPYDSAYDYYDNGYEGPDAFFVTALIVFLPVFITLFLRLKKAELKDPSIRRDPSRRKWVQFVQFITFIVGAIYVVTFLYGVVNGGEGENIVENLIHTAISLLIAGGIFAYYWRDEHRED